MDPGEQIKEFDRKIEKLDRRRKQLEAVYRQKQNRRLKHMIKCSEMYSGGLRIPSSK